MVRFRLLDRFRNVFDWFLLAYSIAVAVIVARIEMPLEYKYFTGIFFGILVTYFLMLRALPLLRRWIYK